MATPLSFDREITKRRIIEAIEEIEGEVSTRSGVISEAGIRQLRELRLALESKPVVDSVQ